MTVGTERLTVLGGFERVDVVEIGGLGVGDIVFGGSLLNVDTAGLTVEVVDGAKECRFAAVVVWRGALAVPARVDRGAEVDGARECLAAVVVVGFFTGAVVCVIPLCRVAGAETGLILEGVPAKLVRVAVFGTSLELEGLLSPVVESFGAFVE